MHTLAHTGCSYCRQSHYECAIFLLPASVFPSSLICHIIWGTSRVDNAARQRKRGRWSLFSFHFKIRLFSLAGKVFILSETFFSPSFKGLSVNDCWPGGERLLNLTIIVIVRRCTIKIYSISPQMPRLPGDKSSNKEMFHWAAFFQLGSLFSIRSCQGVFVSLLSSCLSSRLLRLRVMHRFCSGRENNLLNWWLDSSALFVDLYFFFPPLVNTYIWIY